MHETLGGKGKYTTFLASLFHMLMPRQSKKGQTSIMK